MPFGPSDPSKPWESYQELEFSLKTQPSLSSSDLMALQYKCRICGQVFDKQETCEEHLKGCGTKLLNPVSFVLRDEEEPPVYGGATNFVKNECNSNDNIETTDNIMIDAFEVVDEETTDTHFSSSNTTDMTRLIEELDNDLIETRPQNPSLAKTSNVNCSNTDDNMSLETIQEDIIDEHEIIIETFIDDTSNEEGFKILRVLNLPKNNGSSTAKEKEQIQQEPEKVTTSVTTINKSKPKRKQKLTGTRMRPKILEIIDIKQEQQLKTIKQDLKPKHQVRTYGEKNAKATKTKGEKQAKKIVAKPGKKLYSVIEPPKPNEAEQTEMSVFDFVDEEDEKKKAIDEEHRKKLKDIKNRTCKICNDLFDDPIDLLRHNREKHPRTKVRLPKEKLKLYLDLEPREICPLCFKQISLYHFKSMFIKHILTHAAEPEFECKVCGNKYKRKDHLDDHEKKHVYGVS